MPLKRGDGQLWTIEIRDGSGINNCDDTVATLWPTGNTVGLSRGKKFSLNHPGPIKDLKGRKIQTVDELFAQLDWLLTWVSEQPEGALLQGSGIASRGFIHLYKHDLFN